jgi:hypothetical protein
MRFMALEGSTERNEPHNLVYVSEVDL